MVYALLRCHVRNTLKRGAFWRPSGPDTPARFTPRATWSSLELTRVGDHCGPGRHQEFFFGPTKRHCIRPGVAGGRGAATMARGALETGKPGDIAELHFCHLSPKLRVVNLHVGIPIHLHHANLEEGQNSSASSSRGIYSISIPDRTSQT